VLDQFDGEKVDIRLSEKCGPYIMIAPARIAEVETILRANGIPFTLDDGTNACVGTPEAAVIEFGKDADLEHIQRVLDSAWQSFAAPSRRMLRWRMPRD
jgi:hypothetical protein